MNIGAIIQARMNSSRFPGKVLYNVDGKPILKYLLERLEQCDNLNSIVVATSTEESDNPIEDFCKQNNIVFFRGSLNDVAGRFKKVIEGNQFEAFVRVCGDSPLINSQLIMKGINIFINGNYDIVTNTLLGTCPPGQAVEVLRSDTFCSSYKLMKEMDDLEHVTKYFYRNKNDFKIHNFQLEIDSSQLKLSVDTRQDMDVFGKIISKMDKPHWEYTLDEILPIYKLIQKSNE